MLKVLVLRFGGAGLDVELFRGIVRGEEEEEGRGVMLILISECGVQESVGWGRKVRRSFNWSRWRRRDSGA